MGGRCDRAVDIYSFGEALGDDRAGVRGCSKADGVACRGSAVGPQRLTCFMPCVHDQRRSAALGGECDLGVGAI